MLAHNKSGWTLLEYLKVSEDDIGDFDNVTGSFAVISVNGEYLIGFNSWRQQWEFPAGGIEPGETARDAAIRELYEETHQRQTDLEFKGLFKIKDPKGNIKYQAVFTGFMQALFPFSHTAEDEMEKIRLWDLKEDIGYVDECDLNKDFADGKDIAYLCAFRVKKDYRGKGYGSMLMNTALSDLKSKNFSFATIGVGMDEENNQQMYEHMEFNRKIKECFFDPCARDKDMKPAADEGFILLSKEL